MENHKHKLFDAERQSSYRDRQAKTEITITASNVLTQSATVLRRLAAYFKAELGTPINVQSRNGRTVDNIKTDIIAAWPADIEEIVLTGVAPTVR